MPLTLISPVTSHRIRTSMPSANAHARELSGNVILHINNPRSVAGCFLASIMLPFRSTSYSSGGLANLYFPNKSADPKHPTSVLGPTTPLDSPAVNLKGVDISAAESDSGEEENSVDPAGIIQFYEEDIKDYCIGGYHPVYLGDTFNEKYQIVRKLGFGKFSTVWLALDTSQQRPVALKILKADSYGIERDIHEQESLRYIKSEDPSSKLGLYDHFIHKGPNGDHVCLVFDKLGPDPKTVLEGDT